MSFVSDELANVLKSVYMMEEGSKKDDDEDSSSKVEKKNGDVPKEKRRKHKHKKHSKSKSKDKKKHKKRKHKSRSRSRSVSRSRSRSRSNEREDTLKKSKRRSRSLSSRSKSRSKSPATPEEIEHDFVLEKEKTPEMADDNGAKAGTQENNLNATDGTVGVAKAGSEGKLEKQEICESKVLDDNAQEFYASSVQNASSDKNESCINSVPTTTKEERDRSRSRSRSGDEVNNLKRKKSASKSRSRSKSVDTKTSKSIKKRDSRSGSKDRKTKQRSRSKSSSKESLRKKKSRSRSRSRRRSESRSKERRRKKSHSKSRSRSHSNSSRSRSRSRKRSMSRSRKRSRSRSHRRSKSRSPRRRRSRSRSRKRSPVFRKNFRRFSPRWRRGGGTFRRRWSRSRSRSRSPRRRSSTTRRRSRSRSRGRSRRSRSGSREKRQKRSRSKSRSTSRDRRRSQSRSRSKSKEKTQPANTLPATVVTAVTNKVSSVLDKPVATDLTSQQAKVAQRAGGKTIAELTAFCKKLQEDKQIANNNDNTDTGANTEEDDSQPVAHHPFLVKEKPDITIPAVIFPVNKPPLPTVDPNKPLQEQFPVSCGSKHREKEGFNDAAVVVADVDGSAVQPKVEVFAPPPAEKFDISELVAKRMESQRRLQSDPNDVEALLTLQEIQMKMQNWCQSNVKPGQFTGELVKNLLPKENLQGGYQAWAKKDMFHNLTPVSGGIGMKLLQKMGWKPGQVIGKRGEGYAEPIALTVKIDRKGLSAGKEKAAKKGAAPALLDLQGKHPVSALAEYCSKRKWGLPDYTLVFDHGPAHHKQFLFKVLVNSVEYQPAVVCGNKKQAKAQAAIYALKGLGLIPEDAVISAI